MERQSSISYDPSVDTVVEVSLYGTLVLVVLNLFVVFL
jgi:hypothetical protein